MKYAVHLLVLIFGSVFLVSCGLEGTQQQSEETGFFVLGSLVQRRLLAYDLESRRTLILLDHVGRVRDVAELPSGSLLILLDAGGPGPSSSGRVVKLTPRF